MAGSNDKVLGAVFLFFFPRIPSPRPNKSCVSALCYHLVLHRSCFYGNLLSNVLGQLPRGLVCLAENDGVTGQLRRLWAGNRAGKHRLDDDGCRPLVERPRPLGSHRERTLDGRRSEDGTGRVVDRRDRSEWALLTRVREGGGSEGRQEGGQEERGGVLQEVM